MALQLAVCPGQVQAICARGIDPNLPRLFLEISMFNCVRQEGNNGVHSKHSSSKLQVYMTPTLGGHGNCKKIN